MKILVASDVHGNLEALEEVLQDDYDYFVYLGDVCDYGPDPEPVLE
ncbi:metallophosphoesterase, partial [bacterium]